MGMLTRVQILKKAVYISHSTNTLGKGIYSTSLILAISVIHCTYEHKWVCPIPHNYVGGARGVMVSIVGNGHGNMSSNPGQDWLHFT